MVMLDPDGRKARKAQFPEPTQFIPPAPPPATDLPIPRLELTVTREAGASCDRTITVEGHRVRIGSQQGNEVVVEDRKVSRFHCSLSAGPKGWTLTDTGSLNGTYANGARIRDADLPRGAKFELHLGESVLSIREIGPSSQTHLPALSSFGELYGQSVAMRRVYEVLDRVARSEATVLIQGESGTGKELATHAIVHRGSRADGPFVTVDASAISPTLIESELFGHAKGAFTGADRERKGAFEAADGGTVFLDEIGEMPLDLQPKLLRALEAREIRRVGETRARPVDVRVIAATNRDLEREVNRSRFRGDLYFRLSVVTVQLPPLRERLEDLPLLIQALLDSMGALDRACLFTPAVLDELRARDWPGNVRELRNFVERAVIMGAADFVPARTEPMAASGDASSEAEVGKTDIEEPFKVAKERIIASFERAYLTRLLGWAEGNVSRAARKAKLDRMYLRRLAQRYGLKGPVNDD
jgi:DNA-binding NtrC family response regulator